MKRIKWGIIPLLMCLLFTACKDDEIAGRVEEGLPVSLSMKMIVPRPSEVKTNTRASDEVETTVNKLALLFYKYENSTPGIVEIPKDQLTKHETSSTTHYYYEIKVSAEQLTQAGILSGEYWVYALANWEMGFCGVNLEDVKKMTKTELEEYCVLKNNNLIDLNEGGLLLTGKYVDDSGNDKIILQEGENKFDNFHLKRITAKIIFNFKNGTGANFTPTEYELQNYSRSSTLIERTGWTDKEGSVDAKGTHPGNLLYKGSNDPAAFNSSGKPIQLAPKPSGQDYNFYFYMLENVQPAKNVITDYAERERRVSANDKTFKNAPDKGTYVVVRGTYTGKRGGDGENSGDDVQGTVAYTIHLGDCSSTTGKMDNFTVRRNAKYTYNITVNGVNSIIVEATTDNTEMQPGAEGDIMKSTENVFNLDAHFETVMLNLSKTKIESYSFLAVTPYGTYTQQVQKGETGEPNVEAQYLAWVKFGAPASSTAFNAYPGDSKVVGIYELMNEINDYIDGKSVPEGGWHFIEEGGSLYVTAYVDEYYYENEMKLTKFINAPDRRLAVSHRTSVSPDGESTYTESPIFAINQKSIQSIFALDGNVTRPFGAETYEETEDAVLSTVSYGGGEPNYDYGNAPRPNWGWRNLWEQLDGYDKDNPNKYWNTYVDAAKNGHFKSNAKESDELKIKAMKNDYNVGLYQCFARNRDENGDGKIDVQEMKWYLPAVDECMAFWYGASALSDQVKFNNTATYFTSTNSTFRTWWALEGSTTGLYKDNDAPGGKQRVRCIRTIGAFGQVDNEVSASIVDYDEDKRIIHMHNMGENTIRTAGSQWGEYNPHDLNGTENKLPEAFQFASKDLSITISTGWFERTQDEFDYNEVRNENLCQLYYSEEADESDLGQWRIPNQRELTLMHRYFRDGTVQESSNLSDYTAARTIYKRPEGNALFFVQTGEPDFVTTTWNVGEKLPNQDRFERFKIRCVRDVDLHE